MTGGEGYAQRHLQQSDYYDQNRTVEGRWHGRGAELVGLKGEVTSEDFEAVRQGLDPQTGEFLRQRHGADRIASNGEEQSKARSLYDMTFSAPKSVSVMAIVGGDERLVAAHGTAVREALEEAEKYSATRVRLAGLNENRATGNWIVASYTHDTSRQLDPQLHTHAVAANLTYDGTEGRWKALQASGLYERRSYLTDSLRTSWTNTVNAVPRSVSLTEVQRQTNSIYREAVKTMRHSPEEGFAQLEKLGAIREVPVFDRSQIVADLHREFRAEGRDTLVVAGTHAEIFQLTDAIRHDLKDRGELGVSHSFDRYVSLQWTTAQKQDLSDYQAGQVLQFHRDTKLAKRHESLEVVRVAPESLVARKETGEEVSISPKQTRAFSVYERQPIEVAPGDSLMLTANRRGPELRATNGELVKVSSLDGRAIRLEDGRTLPASRSLISRG
jgi:conjugative relaxase-like TrwC/TraI family protein